MAMAETHNRLHISLVSSRSGARARRSETAVVVPRYSLYGDAAATREWFVNVEPLGGRARARGWRIEPHTHPKFAQLLFVAAGAGEMTLDGDRLPFAAPCLLVVPPFRIHGFRYAEQADGVVLTIENNYLGDLLERAPDLRVILQTAGAFALSAAAHAATAAHLEALRDELVPGRRGGAIGAEAQLLQLLLAALRDRPLPEPGTPTARGDLVDRYLDLVEGRYREQPDVDTLAAELAVTPAQLRHACKAALGLSPLAIIHDRLIAEAKRCLIYTTTAVGEIGFALGFTDAAYFTRFFTRMVGLTPTRFRAGAVVHPDGVADLAAAAG